ncbi:MAG: DNA-binding transcriptional regulator [Myxococcales bacterium]|nr:DNA-binding transcriptional regulator [Myxococcales bacterium]
MEHGPDPQRTDLPADLVTVLAALSDPADVQRLMADLLSPAEARKVGERWAIMKGLTAGETHRAVRDRLGVSIATVSRGSRQLQFGAGGFDLALRTLRRLASDAEGDA